MSQHSAAVQASESYLMAAILSVTGGFLDAYTYISRGGVFANAQTGNFCLMAIALVDGDVLSATRYLFPILAFVLGTLLAESLRRRLMRLQALHWRQVVVLLEIVLLFIVAFLPGTANNLANLLVSFLCAVQGQTFRKFLGNTFASTMCTGNLRSASEHLSRYFTNGDPALRHKSLHYFGIDLLFVCGVMLGAWCTKQLLCSAALVCAGLLTAAFILMFIRPNEAL